jgi:hypothetical protein
MILVLPRTERTPCGSVETEPIEHIAGGGGKEAATLARARDPIDLVAQVRGEHHIGPKRFHQSHLYTLLYTS